MSGAPIRNPVNSVGQAIAAQAASCRSAGSPLYAALLIGLGADHAGGGITADLLDGISDQPVHDAVPLRYLATAHRLALTGAAPALAARYPSCGGRWDGQADELVRAFLATADAHRAEFAAGLRRNVQTNEVGRAAVLASGLAWMTSRYDMPLDQLEVGSSAGILSRWDHFAFDTGTTRCGDETSALGFGPEWWAATSTGGLVDLSSRPTVLRGRASDISPIDLTSAAGRTTMESFVWPDHVVRIERLRLAMAIASSVPVVVERADAGEWLSTELAGGPADGVITVVFHSIVWQYLPAATRTRLRQALVTAGEQASESNPLCWLRMEPATADHADLRVTCWPGGDTVHLADVGYHGADIRWLADPVRARPTSPR